jgi:CCR4-NOT transcription complex subunit 6
MGHNADFLHLQEVDIAQYEDYFTPHLTAYDYEGVYCLESRYKTMNNTDQWLVNFEGNEICELPCLQHFVIID